MWINPYPGCGSIKPGSTKLLLRLPDKSNNPNNYQVTVDYSSNETPEGEIFEDCPAAKIALLVYLGERPEVPLIRHTPFPLAQDPSKRYLVAKIVKFDPPDPTGVQSGIAEIFKPTEQNTLAFTKNSFKRYVEVDSSVRYVRFRRDVMFYLGALQHKADLQYFLSNCAFGMNIFYCYAQPMEGSAGGDCVLFKGEQGRGNFAAKIASKKRSITFNIIFHRCG